MSGGRGEWKLREWKAVPSTGFARGQEVGSPRDCPVGFVAMRWHGEPQVAARGREGLSVAQDQSSKDRDSPKMILDNVRVLFYY